MRLAELGFTPNTTIKILKSFGSGPLLLEVKGSRIALGRGIAMKVLVEVL
jgi:ferrous iron transport protein A